MLKYEQFFFLKKQKCIHLLELKGVVKRRSKQLQFFLEIQIVPIYLNFAL